MSPTSIGQPTLRDGVPVYPIDAEAFVAETAPLFDAGVEMVGGCCGTTPEIMTLLHENVRERLAW